MRSVQVVSGLILAAAAACQPSSSAGQEPEASRVTFNETIAPILYEHCVTCHRPGEIGPFSLISYEDVAQRGAKIASVTASRFMPPWHPAHGFGEFAGERRLSDEEIALIGAWVDQGMERGDPARMPPLPQFPDGWLLGEPDLVLEMPAAFDVPAHGHDVYRNFVLPTGLNEDRWVRAVELRSSARAAAHHALFAYVRQGSFAARDGADGQPGFGGSMAVGFVPGQGSGSLGGWAVGGRGMVLPEGLPLPLPAGTDFLLQMHFHSMGSAARERARVGLYFAPGPPGKSMASLELPALFGFGAGIDIPAGQPSYVVRDTFTLPADVLVHAAWAHAHYLGKEMKVEATLPSGASTPLLWIPDWDFNWQEFYVYRQPVMLPKGTRVDAVIRYDNSAGNRRNPHEPPQRVRWGLHSVDEMGTIGFLLEVLGVEDEPALREALGGRTTAAIQRGAADGTLQRFMAQQAAPDSGAE
jgi:mono/diheme cytochrome c family protein